MSFIDKRGIIWLFNCYISPFPPPHPLYSSVCFMIIFTNESLSRFKGFSHETNEIKSRFKPFLEMRDTFLKRLETTLDFHFLY